MFELALQSSHIIAHAHPRNSYNSIVFHAVDSNDYDVYVATEQFVSGATYDPNGTNYELKHQEGIPSFGLPIGPDVLAQDPKTNQSCPPSHGCLPAFIEDASRSASGLDHLSNQECIRVYATRLLSGRRNLIAVTRDRNSSIPLFANSVTSGSLLFYNSVEANESSTAIHLVISLSTICVQDFLAISRIP